MWEERSLDPPMATSTTMFVLSSGNLGDEVQLLEHETRQGEPPGYCSGRSSTRALAAAPALIAGRRVSDLKWMYILVL